MNLDSLCRLLYLSQALEERGLLQDWKTDEGHRGREAWFPPHPRNAAHVQLDFWMTSRPYFVGDRDSGIGVHLRINVSSCVMGWARRQNGGWTLTTGLGEYLGGFCGFCESSQAGIVLAEDFAAETRTMQCEGAVEGT